MPERVRITRTRDEDGKTWRDRHPGAVIVDRRSDYGNPFRVCRCSCCGMWDVVDDNGVSHHVDHAVARGEAEPTGIVLDTTPAGSDEEQRLEAVAHAVELFESDIVDWAASKLTVGRIRADLKGKDLACWCAPEEPCHSDVLLRIANEETTDA